MSWTRTQSRFFALPAERIWDVVGNPAALPLWNPAVRSLTLAPRTELRAGAQLAYVPNPAFVGAVHARTAPPAVVTRYDDGRALGWRQPQPGGGMLVHWDVSEQRGGTLLTQTVTVDGPGTPVFAATAGRPLSAHFARNCARLQKLAAGPGEG